VRPRVLFVGRTRYRLPLDAPLARKWDALAARMDVRVLASGTGSDPRFRLVPPRSLDGPRFYAGLPVRVARELRAFDPDVVVAESPYEAVAVELGRRATRSRAKVVAEVHGDWRVSTRLYGSRARAAVGPLGDRLADWALRRADAHRAISGFTAGLVRGRLGREPAGVFPTYSDLGAFAGAPAPVPEEPRALFVGVLERYKNVEGLAAAWRLVARRVPEAQLHLVGRGTQTGVAEALAREGARWDRRLEPDEVARALDASRALLLPSNAEGLGRVIIEAFLRARPVVATRVGGIPDLVEHDVNGLLVERGDTDGLAAAIERVLTDRELAQRLGEAGHETAQRWTAGPEEYAANVAALVDSLSTAPGAGPGAVRKV
jgi:glycosyltransferase involved in cell wall biosynthesis